MNFSDTDDNIQAFYEFYEKQLQTISLPDRLAGNYTIKNCLKQSEHREIYLLEDTKENLYVLKKQSGKLSSQLEQEQQIFELLTDIEGLAIPHYLDCWKEQDCCYLLRTYIKGCSLSYYFDHCPHLSDTEIIHYMLGICHLVSILHQQHPPIIHRDIKPENFIIEKGTGILYLVDFDTARVYTPDKSRDTMLIGTPAHAAPEQFGFSQSDVRTDIYALGKTLLYLAYGDTEVINIKSSPIAKPFQKIILHCTDFAPDKRYSDVGQLIRSLKRYQRHLNPSKSYVYQIGMGLLILALGTGLGFMGGTRYEKHNSSGRQSVATGDSRDNNGQSGGKQDNISLSDASLFEQSGAMECDLLQFQDTVDQIILDYYNSDTDAMAKDCEILVEALYKDEAINQVTGTDYAGNPLSYEDDFRAALVHIRDCLAYREQILKRNLGSYSKYKDAIYFNMDICLTPESTDAKSCMYLYATSTGEEASSNYPGSLFDILENILSSFDMVEERKNEVHG